jgi:hypothetical protein
LEELVYPPVAYLTADDNNTWSPHGPVLGSGKTPDGIKGAVYINPGDQIIIDILTGADVHNVDIMCEKWTGDQWIPEDGASVMSIGANGTKTLPANTGNFGTAGYRRWGVRCSASGGNDLTAFSCTAKLQHSSAVMAHRPIVTLFSAGDLVRTVRILGTSIMYSNTTKVLDKSGSVVINQVPKGADWEQYVSYTNVAQTSNRGWFSADKGCYGYLRPSQPEDFDLIDFKQYDSRGQITSFTYDVVPKSAFLVMFIKVDTNDGQSGKWTVCNALEYESDNQLIDKGVGQGNPSVFNDALIAIKEIPQFHENPFHLADILGAAKKVAGAIVKYGPDAINWATKIGNFISSIG